MAGDDTRMLLLGAVALFEPVNGYQIRRELMSWQVDQWANINPGSIYHALTSLSDKGHLTRHDLVDNGRTVAVYEISAGGRVYTFHLRPGARWTDGAPVTAEDFRWSWLRVLRPETASRYANLLEFVRNAKEFGAGRLRDERQVGIAAPDDSTLVATLERPTAWFLHLTHFYTLLPVPRRALERHGNRWTHPDRIVGRSV